MSSGDAVWAHTAYKVKSAIYIKDPAGKFRPLVPARGRAVCLRNGEARKEPFSLLECWTLIPEHARLNRAAGKLRRSVECGSDAWWHR